MYQDEQRYTTRVENFLLMHQYLLHECCGCSANARGPSKSAGFTANEVDFSSFRKIWQWNYLSKCQGVAICGNSWVRAFYRDCWLLDREGTTTDWEKRVLVPKLVDNTRLYETLSVKLRCVALVNERTNIVSSLFSGPVLLFDLEIRTGWLIDYT